MDGARAIAALTVAAAAAAAAVGEDEEDLQAAPAPATADPGWLLMCSCPTGVLFSAARPKKAKIDGAGVSSIHDLEVAIQRTLMLLHALALLL